MPLFRHVATQLVENLNSLNDAVATINDVGFDQVRPTTPEELATKGTNTAARLHGKGSKYYNEATVFYNRIRLDTAFANQLIKLTFNKPFDSLYSQFAVLNDEFSSVFTTEDLEDVIPADPEASSGVITLTAKAESLGWIGSVEMAYEIIEPELMQIPDAELDGYLTPNERIDVSQASLLYAAYDFKDNATWLESLEQGPLAPADLVLLRDALAAKDPDINWVTSGTAPYSLQGAVLEYRGTNQAMFINTLYKQAVVITLSEVSTAVEGTLYLHYSKEGDE